MNSKDIQLSQNWLDLLYARIDNEFASARSNWTTIHQWVISLTVGGLTAAFALNQGEFTYPTPFGFSAVLCILPLMFRFFVRACIEYTLFHRWLRIRNAIDAYLATGRAKSVLKKAKERELKVILANYYFHHWSAHTFLRMVWDNLRIAFLWPFALLIGLIYLGFANLGPDPLVDIVVTFVSIFHDI